MGLTRPFSLEERMQNSIRPVLAALVLAGSVGSFIALAQQPAAPAGQGQAQGQRGGGGGGRQAGPPPPMSFFITSVGIGRGGDLGGLAGADAHCQQLAAAAGRGNAKWVAYLSTQGANAVNARDRIGAGPWFNAAGRPVAASIDELHGDTLPMARQGNRLNKQNSLNERGQPVNGVGDMPNQHDIITGSTTEGRAYTDGMDHTCNNYTSSTEGMGSVQFGHHDRIGNNSGSWVSAHGSRGCSQPNVMAGGGAGLLYCFSPDPPPAQPARQGGAAPAGGRGN
jgi:hypothetical protein